MIQIYTNKEQDRQFYALMGEYFASLDIAKEMERQIYNKSNSVWVVLQDGGGNVMGFASVFDNNTHYFIDNVYVLPPFRGFKLATKLIKIILTYFPILKEKPLKAIANNPKMIHLFNKYGFKEVGNNGKWKKFKKD